MDGKHPVVLVTGASRGIGRAIAEAFGRAQARVAVNFLQNRSQAEASAKAVRESGGEVMLLKADVGDSAQVKAMAGEIVGSWGRIDVCVNNAGITRDRTLLKMTDEEWNDVLRTNLTGSFHVLRECAKVMARQKEGSVINISSIAAVRGAFGNTNYAASKAGVVALTKGAARELGRFNVRVNAVLPGFHLTEMGLPVWEKNKEKILSEHVLGRTPDMKELAEFIVHLSRLQSVSGQVYNFDSRVL